MSARTDFKNALQALTTTCVKAELAQHENPEAFRELRATGLEQWKKLRELHGVFVAEVRGVDPAAPVQHSAWFEGTEKRAEALFGPLPLA